MPAGNAAMTSWRKALGMLCLVFKHEVQSDCGELLKFAKVRHGQ